MQQLTVPDCAAACRAHLVGSLGHWFMHSHASNLRPQCHRPERREPNYGLAPSCKHEGDHAAHLRREADEAHEQEEGRRHCLIWDAHRLSQWAMHARGMTATAVPRVQLFGAKDSFPSGLVAADCRTHA